MTPDPHARPPPQGADTAQQDPPPQYPQPMYPPPVYPPPVYAPPGYAPPQYYYPQPFYVPPAPPAPPDDTPWGAIILGILGGIVALIGAVLPWISFQTCGGNGFFQFCLPFALPGTFNVSSYSAFLPVAAPLALVLCVASIGLYVPNKPLMGLVSSLMSAEAAVIAIAHVIIATPLLPLMGSDLQVQSAEFSVRASIGPGPYILVVGALLLFFAGLVDWKLLKDVEARKAAEAAKPVATAPPA